MPAQFRLALCLFLLGLFSPARALGLFESYNLALANDPTFRAAIKEHEANDANLMIGRSAVLPKVSGGANVATNRLTNTYTGSVSQNFDNYPSTNNFVQILQPLFDLGALAKYKQGMAQKDFGDAKFQSDTYDLLLRTTQVYMDALFVQDQIHFLQSESAAFLEQMRTAEKGIKAGESSKIDYLEARTAYDMSISQILEAQLQSNDAKRKLGILVGTYDANQITLDSLGKKYLFYSDLPKDFSELQNIALANNLDLKAASFKVEVAKQEINKNSANFYPQVGAIASWSRQNSYTVATVNVISNQTTGGIQAVWPIFSSGETTGQTRQAISQYEKSLEEYEGLKLNTLSDLRKYYDQTNLFKTKIQILQTSLDSAKEAQRASVMGVGAGLRSNYDVLVATKNVFNISKDLAQAKYAYILAYLKTRQLSGILRIEDLEHCATSFFPLQAVK